MERWITLVQLTCVVGISSAFRCRVTYNTLPTADCTMRSDTLVCVTGGRCSHKAHIIALSFAQLPISLYRP
jgi:hypothetical protein